MAKKKLDIHCEECVYSYEPHEIGANGKPFLCRCKLHQERSRFLTRDGCGQFKRRL
jgi:hypothetical protein|nr:MAG: hypothetical protein [Bacteriophage sp.]DAQ21899.1 MAG TPA: hypothetical protein [Caudoviricetes sp.]